MMSFEEKLQKWIVGETNGVCEANLVSIPSVAALRQLNIGKNKKIWQYVVERVKSKETVRHVRNVLRVKKAQCELNNLYPLINKNNCEALKQDISKTEDKTNFAESSLSNLRRNIFNLKQSIKFLRGRNHVISQKCTFLELEITNFKEKNESLTAVLENLFSLVHIIISSESTKCQQSSIAQSPDKTSTILQPPNTITYLLFQMSASIKNELLKKKEKLPLSAKLPKSLKKTGNSTNALEFVSMMKQQLKQSEDLLNANNLLTTGLAYQPQQNKLRMSSEHLKLLKLNQVNSSILRIKMTNYSNKMPLLEKVISKENKFVIDIQSETLREFIIVKAQNACLEENIKYLDSILLEELRKIKNIHEKNNAQNSKCVLLKSTVQNFYQILDCIQVLVETTPKTFSDCERKINVSNGFLKLDLFSSLKDEINVCDVTSNLQLNYTGTLNILQSKHFLKSPLHYSDTVEIPEAFWTLLATKPFKSLHLLCEKLTHIKREMFLEEAVLKCDTNEIIEPFECMTESLKNKFKQLKLIADKDMIETTSKCQGLMSFFDEWWHQKAQFIQEIVCDGKSLKMWIDILNALGDF